VEREVINLYEEDYHATRVGMYTEYLNGSKKCAKRETCKPSCRRCTEFNVVEMNESEYRRANDDEDEEGLEARGDDIEDECMYMRSDVPMDGR
jgi:hypothetical protein